jgi:hypothetical protein
MSTDLRLLIDSLDRVRMRLSADHALTVFINSSPSEEELEIAAEKFAHWQYQWGQPRKAA